jgi:NAD(P)-dependent dehydrogenase (short-subunit alcohol dehydrogenase family)
MPLTLDAKTALVTGGSRGIGRAIGERLAADGATVVINYARNEQLAQEVVKAISAKGGKATGFRPTFRNPRMRRLFGEAERR